MIGVLLWGHVEFARTHLLDLSREEFAAGLNITPYELLQKETVDRGDFCTAETIKALLAFSDLLGQPLAVDGIKKANQRYWAEKKLYKLEAKKRPYGLEKVSLGRDELKDIRTRLFGVSVKNFADLVGSKKSTISCLETDPSHPWPAGLAVRVLNLASEKLGAPRASRNEIMEAVRKLEPIEIKPAIVIAAKQRDRTAA